MSNDNSMKNLLYVILFAGVLLVPTVGSAQMMGDFQNPTSNIISSSTDSQKLGQDWMEQMIGPGYDQYQQEMIDMMGPEFFSQLQEAAGKSLQRGQSYLMAPIMGGGYGWRGDDWGRAMGWSVLNGWMHSGWGWLAVFFGIAIAAIAVGIPIGILILIILLIVRMARSIRPTKKEDK